MITISDEDEPVFALVLTEAINSIRLEAERIKRIKDSNILSGKQTAELDKWVDEYIGKPVNLIYRLSKETK